MLTVGLSLIWIMSTVLAWVHHVAYASRMALDC